MPSAVLRSITAANRGLVHTVYGKSFPCSRQAIHPRVRALVCAAALGAGARCPCEGSWFLRSQSGLGGGLGSSRQLSFPSLGHALALTGATSRLLVIQAQWVTSDGRTTWAGRRMAVKATPGYIGVDQFRGDPHIAAHVCAREPVARRRMGSQTYTAMSAPLAGF
jgi:hypothetical protein